MWTELKGWDSPGPENEERCRLFQSGEYNKGKVSLKYRYFKGNAEGQLPLVVFLHGADCVGDDNESQLSLHDVGTVFADAAWQEKHPCHILAPQYRTGMHWAMPEVLECLQALVEDTVKRFDADESRIYIYGYSAGAIGIFSLLKKYPVYAAAIPVCGSTIRLNVERLVQTPMWLFHAADDKIVSPGSMTMAFGSREHMGSHILYEELKDQENAHIYYTEYPEGEMMEKYGLHSHCSWVLMGQDEEAKEWMFSQRKIMR